MVGRELQGGVLPGLNSSGLASLTLMRRMSWVACSMAVTVPLMILAGCVTTSPTSGTSMVQSPVSVAWQASTSPALAEWGRPVSGPPSRTLPSVTLQRQVPQRPDMQLYEMGTLCERSTSSRFFPLSACR